MEMNFSSQEVEDAFERIKSSKLFKRSVLHESILRYLIDQAIEGNDVKEQTIGVDVLNENYDTDQKNSKVRVYVYNLRKKLGEYYASTGKNENLIFHIEKGQYNLTIKENLIKNKKASKPTNINISISIKSALIFLGILILALMAFFIFKKDRNTYVWESMLSKNNTLCIVADQYVVGVKGKGKFSIYSEINTNAQLSEFNKEHPEADLKQSWFTMTTKMAPYGVHYLDQWFGKFNSSFEIQLESDTQFSDYIKSNIVYIGQSKTMVTSKSIFLKNSKMFEMMPDGFIYEKDGEIKKFQSKIKKVDYKEFAMVSYQKLDNGNDTFFFVSNHDIGVLATLKMFTSEEKMRVFFKDFPNNKTEFNALFRVDGLQRNDMNCELVALEIIERAEK